MNPDALHFEVLSPLICVVVGALLLLVIAALRSSPSGGDGQDAVVRARMGTALAVGATFFLLMTLVGVQYLLAEGRSNFFNDAHPMLLVDPTSSLGMGLLALAGLITVWSSLTYLPALGINHTEYYPLLLLSLAGGFTTVCSVNLVGLFLGIELMSVPLHALAGSDCRQPRSNEAGIKSLLTGAFASALSLYGIALIYGATGHIDYWGIRAAFDPDSALAMTGLAFLLTGILFKMAGVPFHQWAPDVYEGAPTPVSGLISITLISAAIFALQRLLVVALPEVMDVLRPLFGAVALLSMLLGSLMALIQGSVKRMLAYSGITHAGFLLAALSLATPEASAAISFYLFFFMFANLGAFGVIAALARRGREWQHFSDYAGLASKRPVLCAAMSLFMLALAGMPGTSGFIARFQILSAVIDADQIGLAIFIALTSIVSCAGYLRLPTLMYMHEGGQEEPGETSWPAILALSICAAALIYFGIFPESGPVPIDAMELARKAALG